jgi:hypothetical protein
VAAADRGADRLHQTAPSWLPVTMASVLVALGWLDRYIDRHGGAVGLAGSIVDQDDDARRSPVARTRKPFTDLTCW